jgi:methyl-accepting chemotaxis protein
MFGLRKRYKELKELNEVLTTQIAHLAQGEFSIHLKESMVTNPVMQDLNQAVVLINDYIDDISSLLARISAGDLSYRMDNGVAYQGDFQPIKNAMDKIVLTLNDLFIHINAMMKNITAVSAHTRGVSLSIADNVKEQTKNIEVISLKSQDIYQLFQQNNAHIKNVSEYIMTAQQESLQGQDYMQHLLNSINAVSIASNNINQVTDIIQAISKQTGLLALNASIEAARAGEAGKGFAIVATEIGKLAIQTAKAVERTTALIQESIQRVGESERFVADTSHSLNKIHESVGRINTENQYIVEESNQEAKAIAQIVNLVNDISDKLQSNVIAVEDSATKNETLLNQVSQLQQLLSYFSTNQERDNRILPMERISEQALSYISEVEAKLSNLAMVNEELLACMEGKPNVECAYLIGEDAIQVSKTILSESIQIGKNNFSPAKPGDNYKKKKYFTEALYQKGKEYITFEYISNATGNLCKTFSRVVWVNDCRYVLCVDVALKLN